MPEGILKFNLDDIDEKNLFHLTSRALDLYLLLKDIEDTLCREVKYKNNPQAKIIQELLIEKMREYNLMFDMVR